MSDLIDRDAAMKLRDTLADIIGAAPMSSIHSALSEYRKAIRALPAVDVGVKPLEWFEVEKYRYGGKYTSEGYTIRYVEGFFILDFAGYGKAAWRFPTIEAAKAAAQADYAARIRSALTVTPAPDVVEIDLRAVSMEEIEKAAGQSPWVPPEYTMNEIVSDCCSFLREPRESAPDAGNVQALVEAVKDIADPKRLTSHGDPTVLRDHARAALASIKETPHE